MKWIISILFLVLYAAVTFFGLGPVLFADGSDAERMITLVFVIIIYIVLTLLLIWIRKKYGT